MAKLKPLLCALASAPPFTAGIFLHHAVGHHCALQASIIAERDLFALLRQLGQFATHLAALGFGELGQRFDDFSSAHDANNGNSTPRKRVIALFNFMEGFGVPF
ncbi:MAG: hypothetical protein DME24_14240 [Verrucomicrobia bacterium]|nr:MAG: hypothetical protein DME24_14240 [Verrucomicrobiota bacterium]